MSEKETKKLLEEESRNFQRFDLVHNLDFASTKLRVIHDFTCMVKELTFPLEILLGENCLGRLSECVLFFRMAPYVSFFDISKCYTLVRTTGDFL